MLTAITTTLVIAFTAMPQIQAPARGMVHLLPQPPTLH